MLTLFGKIAEHLFGHKYFIVSLQEGMSANGIGQTMLSSFIFRSKAEAVDFFNRQKYNNRTMQPVEIISFRSRKDYRTHSDAWNFNLNR